MPPPSSNWRAARKWQLSGHAFRVYRTRGDVCLGSDKGNMTDRKRRGRVRRPSASMTFVSHAFTPTPNRRLNELVGFLALVFATLLVLALISYSPLDPSWNTAATPPASRPSNT